MTTRRLYLPICLAALLLPAAIVWHHAPGRFWGLTPDADLIYVGEALALIDGRPHGYVDHPAYLYLLLLKGWLLALGQVGLIPRPSLAQAVAAPDLGAYMQEMIWGGRMLAALLACSCGGLFIAGLRAMGVGRTVAALAGLLLASSQGVAVQSVILRAELPSAMATMGCVLALGAAARRPLPASLAWMAAAGALAVLALESKVQAVIPLLALVAVAPLLPPSPPSLRPGAGLTATALFALAASLPAAVMVISVMLWGELGPAQGYQWALAALVAGAVIVRTRLERQPLSQGGLGLLALGFGMAMALYLVFLHPSPRTVEAMVHFVEHMSAFTSATMRDDPLGGLLNSVGGVAARHLAWRPMALVEAAALAGLAVLLRRRQWRHALLTAGLLGTALAVEVAFTLRQVYPHYLLYLEPWSILAAAIAAQAVLPPRARPAAAIAVAALVVWNTSLALRPGLVPRQPASNICAQADAYLAPDLARRFAPYCR